MPRQDRVGRVIQPQVHCSTCQTANCHMLLHAIHHMLRSASYHIVSCCMAFTKHSVQGASRQPCLNWRQQRAATRSPCSEPNKPVIRATFNKAQPLTQKPAACLPAAAAAFIQSQTMPDRQESRQGCSQGVAAAGKVSKERFLKQIRNLASTWNHLSQMDCQSSLSRIRARHQQVQVR